MKKFVALLLCVLMAAALLVSCGGGGTSTPSPSTPPATNAPPATSGSPAPSTTPPPAVNTKTLRASTPTEPGAGWTVALDTIAEDVYKNTNGAYKIDIYTNASLSEGSEKTMTEQVYVGTLDMCVTPASLASAEWSAFSVPFLFDDRDHIWRVCESDVVQGMLDKMSEKGMKAIGIVENGFFQITNNVREIKVPADTAGIKMRTPQAPSSIASAEMMGFNAVAISSGELYVALQQGTADGQQNSLSTIFNKGFADVQKYLTVVNVNWSPALIGINLDLWESFDADTQAIFTEAIKHGAQVCNDMLAEEDAGFVPKLQEKGMQVYTCTADDLKLWKEALSGAADLYKDGVGPELMEDFLAAVESNR